MMLPGDLPAEGYLNNSLDLLGLFMLLVVLETEQQKLHLHIANNEQRIATLETTLQRLQALPGYQQDFSLVENLRMALGTLNESIAMARSVLAAENLADAHASAACYLASVGISHDHAPSIRGTENPPGITPDRP